MDNPFIWDNLLIGIERMLASGLPHEAVGELRIVFLIALKEKRISQDTLNRFDHLIRR
jgi:hypothetical protein